MLTSNLLLTTKDEVCVITENKRTKLKCLHEKGALSDLAGQIVTVKRYLGRAAARLMNVSETE